MTDWANTADAGRNARHFPKRATLAELFKSSEFRHMKTGIRYRPSLIEMDGDFGMPLNAGDGIDNNALRNQCLLVGWRVRYELSKPNFFPL